MISTAVRRATRLQTRSFAVAKVSAAQMKQSKHDFVHFVNQAALHKDSPERVELYKYLNQCFTDNDTDYDGLISYRGFNAMIDEAAMAPRRFGFAPHTREMYKSKEEFDLARTELFNKLKSEGGRINFETWSKWGMAHVQEKVGKGLAEHKEGKWERSKEDLMDFCKGVVKEKSSHNMKSSTSTQAKEWYLLNNQMFTMYDTSYTGLLNKADFEKLAMEMDKIPAKFGMSWFAKLKFDDIAKGKSGVGMKQWMDVSFTVMMDHAK